VPRKGEPLPRRGNAAQDPGGLGGRVPTKCQRCGKKTLPLIRGVYPKWLCSQCWEIVNRRR
jgi:hypothetical protein